MIECPKFEDGKCAVATAIAGRSISAHPINCGLCLKSDQSQQDNKFIRGLIKAAGGIPAKPKPVVMSGHGDSLTVHKDGFRRGGIGFIAASYWQHGGTEVWHQSLLPRLDNVSGFVCINEDASHENLARLGCRYGVGFQAARHLAIACDVVVVWALGHELERALNVPRKPAVISVSHCDKRSDWTTRLMHEQNRHADKNVVICPSGFEGVPKSEDGNRTKTVLIPNAPDPLRVQPVEGREATRRKHGISEDKKLIVMVSRISTEKRIDVMVDAMKALGDDFHLLVVGPTSMAQPKYLDAMKAVSGANVSWADAVRQPGDILAAADAFASPSTYEGFGLSMAEAMLAGVPVIATPVGLLEDDTSLAHIVPLASSPTDWANAIRRDFDNPEQQARRVALARMMMQTKFGVDRWVGKWQRLASKLANRRGRRTYEEATAIIDEHCKNCPNYAKTGCGKGCSLLRSIGRSPCQTREYIYQGGGCPAGEPRF